MALMLVTKLGILMTAAHSPTTAKLMPTPKSAVRIGRPMAMIDPKAISRMTTAASRPKTSLGGSSNLAKYWPLNSVTTPSVRRLSASFGSVGPTFSRLAPFANVTVDVPIVLSGEIDGRCASKGELAVAMALFFENVAKNASMAGLLAASPPLSAGTSKTIDPVRSPA